jgi:hypothetical protein
MEKSKIFLSHRHSDTQSDCHRIRETLEQEFGEDAVFLDIENLEPGIRFADAIDKALKESKVVLVAIGPDWFGDPDENGVTRLFQEKDWVRREVSAALTKPDTRVIPLLLKGASRPTADQLPDELKELADLQTFEISITRWKYDLGVLVEALAKLIPRKKKPAGPFPYNPTPIPRPKKSWWGRNYLWVLGIFVVLMIVMISSEEFQDGYQDGLNGSETVYDDEFLDEPEESLTSIYVIYTGDDYGCALDLKINIGGKIFTPVGNEYLISGLKQGTQPYSITGIIGCPNQGTCTANGSGNLEIIPNGNYYVSWNTTEVGNCAIKLSMH